MTKIAWIASYPKSGNTWLRFQLASLVSGPITQSAELAKTIPDIHEGIRADHLIRNSALMIKTHWAYRDDLPLREDSIGAVYIVRHPLDVLASNLNYHLLRLGKAVTEMDEERVQAERRSYIADYLNRGGDRDWFGHGAESWQHNVRSWTTGECPFPRLLVRYEEMLADPVRVLTVVANFLRMNKPPEDIAAAAAASKFSEMRAIEESEIQAGQPGFFFSPTYSGGHDVGLRFMNKGQSQNFRAILTPAEIERATTVFAPTMSQLGYEP